MTEQVNLNEVDPWPYTKTTYIRRIIWLLVHRTIWRLCWKRLSFLRAAILKGFGARVPKRIEIDGSAKIQFPDLLQTGSLVAIGPRVDIYNLGGIRIGDQVIISQDAYLCGGTHDYEKMNIPLVRKEIVIGSHVWIGAGAFIGPGVTVGDGAVVGARAVVMKDVPNWAVVVGNPAKKLKTRPDFDVN